jgi:glycosyltransferase involved in cell wall biosynthesis
VLTKVLELELAGPCEVPPIPARYDWLRLLVRLHGYPVGYLEVENDVAQLGSTALRERAARILGERIWAELLVGRWTDGRLDGSGEVPAVSVVVCTRNRAGLLEGCLAALAEQQYPRYEVIVVDNAPDDDTTREVAERFSVRRVVEPRPGLDLARNKGLSESRAPIVAYTDDDARPDGGWIAAIVAGFVSPEVQAVTGLVRPAELETDAQALFEDGYGGMGKGFDAGLHSRRGWKKLTYRPHEGGVGCNMAFRREALERLGGFDPALDVGTLTGGGGDLDIFQRLIEADGVIVYRPDAIVGHKHRRGWVGLKRQLFDNGRAYSAVLWAALLRARGAERLGVVTAYWRWIWQWHVCRIASRLFRRGEKMPLEFLLSELRGALVGPVVYALARRRVRRLA